MTKTADQIRAEEEAAEVEDYTPSAVCLHILAVELAHREALEAEAIKRGIDAKLAANGFQPNGLPIQA